tara:strand:- start:1197 stop:2495 length:1299 start_codon:yes stop_codon:yes gene_type:complete
MSKKEILEQEQEVQEETEVQVSEEDQVELEELSTPGQGQSSTDKTNTGATGVSAAKRSLDKASPQDSMPTLAADQGAQEVGADPTMSGAEDGGKSTTKPNYASSVGKAKSGKMSESATRMGMIKDIYDLLQEMDKDSIEEVRKALSEEESSEETVEENENTQVLSEDELDELKKEYQIDVKSDVEALIQGEELSEEFKEKAATIFEAAVFAKVNEEVNSRVEALEEQYKTELEGSILETREEMVKKVDDYLNYVVKEWMQENELAIEKGIRSEIVEDFMVGLKNLFVEHYIDIPEEKVDLVDDLFAKVEDLEESLNKEMEKNVDMQSELKEYKKFEAIANISEDLTDVQVEKMQKLAETVDFESEDEYAEKLQVIKENYFPANGSVASEESTNDDSQPEVLTEEEAKEVEETAEMSDTMKWYSSAISRTIKK